jgi:hypothetical protein
MANIGRKFELCFKHRDESNLNAAAGGIASETWLSIQVPVDSQLLPAP